MTKMISMVMRRVLITGAILFLAGAQVAGAQTVAPATGVNITSGVPSPQVVGTPVTFTAAGIGSAGYQYRFFLTVAGSGVYTMVQDYGAAATWTMPATTAAGAYQVIVHVRTTTTVPFDAQAGVDFVISSVPAATGVTIASSLPSPQVVGTAVTFTAAGTGSSGYQYRFWLTTAGSGVFTMVQDYGVGSTWTLPATTAAGAYRVIVHVRTTANGPFEAQAGQDFTVALPPATGVALTASLPSPQLAGTAVVFTAAGTGSSGYDYRFWIAPAGSAAFVVAQDYGNGASWTLPATTAPGTYRVIVHVRTSAAVAADAQAGLDYTVAVPPATSVTLTPGSASPQLAGTPVTFSAVAAGSAGYQYRFWIAPAGTVAYSIVQDYSAASSWTMPTTMAAGGYRVIVHVRTDASRPFDAQAGVDYTLTAPPAPVISTVTPATGSIAGGTAVTISGSNFAAGAAVAFGPGNPATVVSLTATSISVTTPAHAAGAVDVTVTNPDGQTASAPLAFTYGTPAAPAPTIAAITPASDTTAGGATVQIAGTGFATGLTVTLGGSAANVFAVTPTILRLLVPAHAAGAVDVIVRNPDGQSATAVGGFTYVPVPAAAPPPVIASITPASGPLAGAPVAISGSGFAFGVKVLFGGVPGTVSSFTSTLMNVIAPASAVGGFVDVTVTNLDGQSATLAKGFDYVAPPPVISTLNIHGAPMAGNTVVLIAGTGFQPGATVTFGSTPALGAPIFDPVNNTLQVTTPPGPPGTPGPTGALEAFVTVTVTNPDGQSAGVGNFHYGPPPTASDFFIDTNAASKTLNNGKAGQLIDILGTEFSVQPGRGVQVLFSGPSAGFGTIDPRSNATTLTVGIPKLNPGNYQIIVTNFDGQFTRVPGTLIILGP